MTTPTRKERRGRELTNAGLTQRERDRKKALARIVRAGLQLTGRTEKG